MPQKRYCFLVHLPWRPSRVAWLLFVVTRTRQGVRWQLQTQTIVDPLSHHHVCWTAFAHRSHPPRCDLSELSIYSGRRKRSLLHFKRRPRKWRGWNTDPGDVSYKTVGHNMVNMPAKNQVMESQAATRSEKPGLQAWMPMSLLRMSWVSRLNVVLPSGRGRTGWLMMYQSSLPVPDSKWSDCVGWMVAWCCLVWAQMSESGEGAGGGKGYDSFEVGL